MKSKNTMASRIFWAILILGGGVLLLLSALGIGVDSDPYKIVGSLLLLGVAVSSLVKLRYFFTVLPLAGMVYLWRDLLGFPDVQLWPLLGAGALLGIGLSVLFHKKSDFHVRMHRHNDDDDDDDCKDCGSSDKDVKVETLDAGESASIDCNFGEQTKYIHADNLKKVSLNVSFGEVKAYFDQCKVDPEGLTIQVNSSFCGISLMVPRTWAVENHISSFAAAVNDQGPETTPSEARVKLVGSLNFAEIKIIRV
jgi:hypothetical protein